MKYNVSTISWIWDKYGFKFTEIRKALQASSETNEIPTQQLTPKRCNHSNDPQE